MAQEAMADSIRILEQIVTVDNPMNGGQWN